MTVMAAGVHLARCLRCVRLPCRFLDGQGVHVRAHADDPIAREPALDHADNAGPADAGDHLVTAEFAQLLLYDPRRAMDVIVELGVLVQIAAPCGDFVGKCRDTVDDGHEDLELEWERVTTKN